MIQNSNHKFYFKIVFFNFICIRVLQVLLSKYYQDGELVSGIIFDGTLHYENNDSGDGIAKVLDHMEILLNRN